MTAELASALSKDSIIYLLSDPIDTDLQRWLLESGLDMNVRIVETLPQCPSTATGVAFIVNSAYLHNTSIKNALLAGYNVICEKPMSLSRQETLSLIRMAARLELQLFCTNTYLFASYLDIFRKDWIVPHRFTRMRVSWSDEVRETRYGETKSHDSSIPLIYDVLPHIATILLATIGDFTVTSKNLQVRRGGSEILINYIYGDLDLYVKLERNASKRTRTLVLTNAVCETLLDFSNEPGMVSVNKSKPILVDSGWSCKPKPIATMLNSVQEFFEFGRQDNRLRSSASLLGHDLIESVVDSYIQQQILLLSTYSNTFEITTNSLAYNYALKEATSISVRALPYLCENSPLRQLASLVNFSNSHI